MTTRTNNELVIRVVREAVEQKVLEQKWYQRYANTVTATLTGLATFFYWLLTSGLELHPYVHAAGGLVMVLATVFGVNKTKNGMSPSSAEAVNEMVEETVGRHRRIE